MTKKENTKGLAVFEGNQLFATPKSTSNLLQPDIEKFLNYSRVFFDQHQYTNNGPNVKLLEKRLAEFHQTDFCVTFSSGFWAIALAIRSLALKNKSEIIMPSLTYRRMTDIAAWIELKPHFCEVDPNLLSMTADTVETCINENTALILGVHPIVNTCDSAELVELAGRYNIPILFDSVESVYESTATGKVGSFGAAECFSLHACKLLNGFGGGYLTSNDENLTKELSSLRTFGFTALDHVAQSGGMNAKLNELHAAMALASLDDLPGQIEQNRKRYKTYQSALESVPGLRLLEFDERYPTGYKNIVVELLDDWPLSRKLTIKTLNAENILARAHYHPPLHRKEMQFAFVSAELPLTDSLTERYLNLPCGQLVSSQDIIDIVDFLRFISLNARSILNRFGKSPAP